MNIRKTLLATSAGTLALAIGLPAAAQTAEVEELVVTARKRDETLIEVPFSINAQRASSRCATAA
jgi:iron complex outermembrane recepter protein